MRIQRHNIIINFITVALVILPMHSSYASTCRDIFTELSNSTQDELTQITVTELEDLNSSFENAITRFQERKLSVKNLVKELYTKYMDIKTMQEKQPGFNINITELENILKKEITPEELQEVSTEAQNAEMNHRNVILLSRHPTPKNIEEKLIKFDELIQKLQLMRLQLADAIEIIEGRGTLLKDASQEAQEQWPSLNINIAEIENAIKEATPPTELPSKENGDNVISLPPIELKSPINKNKKPSDDNVISFPSTNANNNAKN